jgi:riboflavin synthase
MFTGIVEEIGTVVSIDRDGDRARLHIGSKQVVEDAQLGDSISVSGCCLTVTELPDDGFVADLMAETLGATALGDLTAGSPVNLERAMRADDRFGGHLVQGHVDAVGEVLAREEQPGMVLLTVRAPAQLGRYLVPKGSVSVAGASLTIVDLVDVATFRVGLIPHTLEVTTFGDLRPGDRVNLEVDVIAKYVERLLQGGGASPYTSGEAAGAGTDA